MEQNIVCNVALVFSRAFETGEGAHPAPDPPHQC